jgi:fructose-bisphosphate aldolase class 1
MGDRVMSLNNIEEIATYIVAEGKGILAADESNPYLWKEI